MRGGHYPHRGPAREDEGVPQDEQRVSAAISAEGNRPERIHIVQWFGPFSGTLVSNRSEGAVGRGGLSVSEQSF